MKVFKEGENIAVVCYQCGKSTATFRLRDVDFDDHSGTVKNILAGVCDQCDTVVAIPPQSEPQIKREYERTHSALEVRVPAHFLNILSLATLKIAPRVSDEFSKVLILYYLHALNSGRFAQDQLKTLLASDMAKARASKRISMKVSHNQLAELNSLMKQLALTKTSDVIRAVILKIHQDLIEE
ncbi:hypothetical protein, partial [Erwinia sp. B116]